MKLKVTAIAEPPFSFQEDKQLHSEFRTHPEDDIPEIQNYRLNVSLNYVKKKKKMPSGA